MTLKSTTACIFLLIITIIDCKKFIIPDLILIIFFMTMLAFDLYTGKESIPRHAVEALVMFLIFWLIYHFSGGLGFGDVKLIGCITYTFGFISSIYVCLAASIMGLVFFGVNRVIGVKKLKRIPFAPFLTVGCIVYLILRGLVK